MVVIAVGVGGRLGADRSAGPTAATTAPPAAVASAAPSSGGPVVALSEPAPPPASVSGIPLWVRGRVTGDVHAILLVLRSDGGEVARQTTRPGRSGRFAAVFTLQPPRPEMELTVVATALDAREATIGEAEQAVRVEPLHRVAAAPSPSPRLGEDGVLGSRGVDLSELGSNSLGSGAVGSTVAAAGWPWPRPGGLAEQAYR